MHACGKGLYMYAPDSLSTTLLLYFTIYLHSSTQQDEIMGLINTYGENSPEILNRFNWDAGSYAALQNAFQEAEKNFQCRLVDLPPTPTPVCTFVCIYSNMGCGHASTQCYCCFLSCLFHCRHRQQLAGMSCL